MEVNILSIANMKNLHKDKNGFVSTKVILDNFSRESLGQRE